MTPHANIRSLSNSAQFTRTRTEEAIKTWNGHSSYRWVYFPEEAKQLMQFFLSKRIRGKNLDVGSGWYSYYPNSTAVDFSPEALKHNPSKEKVEFNLDDIACGAPLPFTDHSFNSATLVSVWQYIHQRKALLRELERVLTPGSEVYIINQSGASLEGCAVASSSPLEIKKEIEKIGYSAIREVIPFGGSQNPFESVTVAMPYVDLFGKRTDVQDAKNKVEESRLRTKDPHDFYAEFAEWETNRARKAFSRIATYPITQFSVDYQQRIQQFADAVEQETDKTVLVFMEYDGLPAFHMATAEHTPFFTVAPLYKTSEQREGSHKDIETLLRKHQLKSGLHLNYLHAHTVSGVEERARDIPDKKPWHESSGRGWESSVEVFTRFVGCASLTEQTKAMQQHVYSLLKPKIKDIDERIERARKDQIYMLGHENKQERRINEYALRKAQILTEGIPAVGVGTFEYLSAMTHYAEHVRSNLTESYRNWPPRLSDD